MGILRRNVEGNVGSVGLGRSYSRAGVMTLSVSGVVVVVRGGGGGPRYWESDFLGGMEGFYTYHSCIHTWHTNT